MRVLVTGANGLLGQKLLELLESNPRVELFATTRSVVDLPFRAAFHRLDITDEAGVHKTISTLRPDVVIHTAAMTQVDACEQDREACWRVNVDGVGNLVRACDNLPCHFIYLSTDFIFSGDHGPLTEEDEPRPVNFYGESKLEAEEIVRTMTGKWSIVRTVLMYGITQDMRRSNIVLWVKENLQQGKTIRVVNDQWRTPTLAEDLAMGCWLVADKGVAGVFHISGKDMLSPYQIAIRTSEYYELDASLIVPVGSDELQQPARRPLKTGFIINKARKELGYEPRSFDEGMAIMAGQIV